jgi:hypothetical protein
VFDDIEAGRFLEQPAGEHASVLRLPTFTDVDLHKGAGFLRQFPRRGALARGQADDHRANLAGFTGLQLDLLRDIVALVEQAQHRDTLRKRGRAVILGGRGGAAGRRRGRRLVERHRDGLRLSRAITSGQRKRRCERHGNRQTKADTPHVPPQLSALPGVHAS